MFSYFTGTITEKIFDGANPYFCLELNKIGYQIFTNIKTLSQLESNQEKKIYLSVAVREDSHKLYGFINKASRDLFETLISVSGIGPKAALNILNVLDTDQLIKAVLNDEPQLLAAAPGIGLKSAQKIILELKNKLKKFHDTQGLNLSKTDFDHATDIIPVLLNLGFSATEVSDRLSRAKKANIADDSELLLKYCLQN
jgi:Holliday junction DNA helicase RuvA